MHVDFFIAGVQKGGTTALDAFLRRHPAVQMAAVKEPHFFDNETLDWERPDYSGLHRHFEPSSSPNVIRGEATPIYTYWRNCLERLQRYNPRAKLVVLLRHPAWRAFSHWRMETTRAAEHLPFGEAIRAGRDRVSGEASGQHRVFSYVERGLYSQQIDRLLSLFPREQLYFTRTDELWREPAREIDRVCSFLGLHDPPSTARGEYIVPLMSAELGRPSNADLDYLYSQFDADIRRTAERSNLDLSDWMRPGYTEPMSG